jgi:hypothetical protein
MLNGKPLVYLVSINLVFIIALSASANLPLAIFPQVYNPRVAGKPLALRVPRLAFTVFTIHASLAGLARIGARVVAFQIVGRDDIATRLRVNHILVGNDTLVHRVERLPPNAATVATSGTAGRFGILRSETTLHRRQRQVLGALWSRRRRAKAEGREVLRLPTRQRTLQTRQARIVGGRCQRFVRARRGLRVRHSYALDSRGGGTLGVHREESRAHLEQSGVQTLVQSRTLGFHG